jgi:8-oxo-dGTP pyrophosphatase MutT (NUDIX family)
MHSNAMGAGARSARDSRLNVIRSTTRVSRPWAAPIRLSQLHKMRECEQVAAVCYRVRGGAIEFLLVQTRGSGRWTFPKGSAEAGLTHAQAAAIEAFEEAGVHGRIEEASFIRYAYRRQSGTASSVGSAAKGLAVSAHLCEVRRLCTPKESNRNRTWFSVQETKKRLRQGRKSEDGAEFARVVSRAVARIQRSRSASALVEHSREDRSQEVRSAWDVPAKDELHKVQFEARAENRGRMEEAFLVPYIRRGTDRMPQVAALPGDARRREILPCEVLQFGPPRQFNRSPKLLSGVKKAKA